MAVCTCSYQTSDLRNVAFAGHAGSGKTSITEALVQTIGLIGKTGLVENGDTLTDFTPLEQQHQQSLFAAMVHAEVKREIEGESKSIQINIVDTPGSPDFVGQAIAALPAVETVALVINAANGIEPVTRKLMDRAHERNQPVMVVINKIDMVSVDDLQQLVLSIKETFGDQCLPINLPANDRKAVVDCFFKPDGESDFGPVSAAHTAIVDQVVEVDEELMMTYLDQGEVKPEQLHEPFEKALRDGHLVPICFTASLPAHGASGEPPVGIDELLDIIVRLAPNPKEGNPRPFLKGDDAEHLIHAKPDPDAHVLAHVFNIRIDPFVGKLAAMRVHQGTITKDSQLFIGDPKHGESKKPVKVGHLFKLCGKQHIEVDRAIPGDLIALAKIDDVHFDCVLHDHHDEDAIHLLPLNFPEPLYALAISSSKRGDEQKLMDALHRLEEEDPTFNVTFDAVTHETVIHGLGELHIRIVLERLANEFHLAVETHEPRIAYKTTILTQAKAQYRHKKQTGGAGQFGEVHLRVDPLGRGEGFVFIDEIVGGAIPHTYIPAIEKGVRMAMASGSLGGFPVEDVKVTVYDGKHHPVDSKEIAFIEAGKRAFMAAFEDAKPTVLEPMVDVEVTIPADYMGDVTGDLSSKRGRINGSDVLPGNFAVVKATMPLAELGTYQNQLKSMTSGQGSFTMELSGYEPAPGDAQQRILASAKAKDATNVGK